MKDTIKILILLLLTLSLGATMSITIPAIIKTSNKFLGAYEVVHYVQSPLPAGLGTRLKREVVPCANLATARTVARNLADDGANVVPLPVSVERSLLSAEQLGGCRTGGLGYDPAVTWAVTGRVERVHNWATARSLSDRYPVRT